ICSARFDSVTSRKLHTRPTLFPAIRWGWEKRSKMRPSLEVRTSKLDASGRAYRSRTLLRNPWGSASCSNTNAMVWAWSLASRIESGIRHSSANVRLQLTMRPARSTTRIPSGVDHGPVRPEQHDDVARVLDQRAEPLLARVQPLGRPLAIGDVPADQHHLIAAHGRDRPGKPDLAAPDRQPVLEVDRRAGLEGG